MSRPTLHWWHIVAIWAAAFALHLVNGRHDAERDRLAKLRREAAPRPVLDPKAEALALLVRGRR